MSVNDPMMESKHHLPECTLPKGHGDCICGELRAAEQRVTSDFAKYLRHMVDDDKFAAGVKAARDAVAALPWKVAVSFGPIDCDRSCEHGPCVCSGVMRPEAWLTGPADALAAIDALTGGDNSNGGNQP